jgi:TetR/AcrR family transcriptional regulator, regulator of cefoperazone and chloramphenicol sensitivity
LGQLFYWSESEVRRLRSDALNTRQSLLEAAGEIFARKGFWRATHEEICGKAGANTASVNYHFGSKENLYVEAWKHSYKKSVEKYPLEGDASPGDSAEKRLKGWVLSFLKRVSDPKTYAANIMLKEMANPTGLLKDVITPTIEPSDRVLSSAIKELAGNGASEDVVGFCYMSLLSLCFGPLLHRKSAKEPSQMPRHDFITGLGVEELADYIIQFSLSGIYSFNKTVKSGKSHPRTKNTLKKKSK